MNGKPSKEDLITYIIAVVVVLVIMIVVAINAFEDSGTSYNDLSDVEKQNAEWAYYAQQAIDDYNN